MLSDDDGSSNLFMRPESNANDGQPLPERTITPITDRENEQGPADIMDNTLDQYIEDLREANKQADIRKQEMASGNHTSQVYHAEPVPQMPQPEQTETPKSAPRQQKMQSRRSSQGTLAASKRDFNLGSGRGLKIPSPVRKTRKNSNGRPLKTEESQKVSSTSA